MMIKFTKKTRRRDFLTQKTGNIFGFCWKKNTAHTKKKYRFRYIQKENRLFIYLFKIKNSAPLESENTGRHPLVTANANSSLSETLMNLLAHLNIANKDLES